MMDRTASHQLLAASANRTARRVFASLSFNQRLAVVYLKLASEFGKHFGQAVYATALYYGAVDLPEIKGAPASNFGPKEGESVKAFVNRFLRSPAQRDYGHAFGKKFYGYCRKLWGDPSLADDAIMDIMAMLLDPGSTLHHFFQKKAPLKAIESFIFNTAQNKFKDAIRRRKSQKTDGLPSDDEGNELDLPDSNIEPDNLPNKQLLEKLDQKLNDPDIRRQVEHAAKALGPDLDTYFKLLMDGFEPREVYDLRLLPSMQTNLPQELRLDPTRPDPFETVSHKVRDQGGLSNKKREILFKEELGKYPNPSYNNPTSFLNHHRSLMQALQHAIEN